MSRWFFLQIRLILQILFFITNQGDTKVDPDDQVMDVYSYRNPDFEPIIIPIFVSARVLRQVFSDIFYSMANTKGVKNVFNGDTYNKVPAFSNELVANGFFEVLGKMIVHSLIQSGPGFPHLSPTIYRCLAEEGQYG